MWVYIIGYTISSYLIGGIVFSDIQHSGLPKFAKGHLRSDYGFAVMMGLTGAIFRFVVLPMIYLATGFAEHGVWKECKDGNKEDNIKPK